jgi:hypothetical protein
VVRVIAPRLVRVVTTTENAARLGVFSVIAVRRWPRREIVLAPVARRTALTTRWPFGAVKV